MRDDADQQDMLQRMVTVVKLMHPRQKIAADGVSHVYFIQSGESGPIKIGFSSNVYSRLAHIQAHNPNEMRLLGCFRGGRAEERALHQLFARDRLRGEWFKVSPELLKLAEAE